MEQKWEQGRDSLAIPGAILGAALGADCLAAMVRFGDVPLILCGALTALFAVRTGALTAGRVGRTRTLLALPWVLLFDCLGHHLYFALETASRTQYQPGRGLRNARHTPAGSPGAVSRAKQK